MGPEHLPVFPALRYGERWLRPWSVPYSAAMPGITSRLLQERSKPQKNIGLEPFPGHPDRYRHLCVGKHYVRQCHALHDIANARQDRVAVAASQVIFGETGTYLIAVMIAISTFGCNNGLILAGARVYYTMAKDGLFFRKTGELNQYDVPEFALWIQCIVASMLCLSGQYGNLLDMISFVVVMFLCLTILGIFILRKKT